MMCISHNILTADQLLFDVWGFGWVWVGLGHHGSIISPGSGLGWVGSVIWWVGFGSVDENRPTDNSDINRESKNPTPYFWPIAC